MAQARGLSLAGLIATAGGLLSFRKKRPAEE